MPDGKIGPLHRFMGQVVTIPVTAFVISKVPKKANAVLFEPVVLLILNFKGRVVGNPGVQVMQEPVPKNAPTTSKSLDVHLRSRTTSQVLISKIASEVGHCPYDFSSGKRRQINNRKVNKAAFLSSSKPFTFKIQF